MRCSLRLLSSSTGGGGGAGGGGVAGPTSFVDRVRVAGANAMLGEHFGGGGFDNVLEKSLVVKMIGDGYVQCDFEIKKQHSNAFGNLHGGCTSLLVDVVGTMALLSLNPLKPGVSVEMNQTFLRAAAIGDKIEVEGRVLKTGKKLGFTEVTLKNQHAEIIAIGRHTKAFQ